jgi:hypothetical protein
MSHVGSLPRPIAFARLAGILASFAATDVIAADLPSHAPLRILIVSDEVNPHGLTPAQLTQPGDLSAALNAPGNGLSIDTVTEIPTDNLPQATAALSVPITDPTAYDVLIYFAHRIPLGGGGPTAQAAFVTAVEGFLEDGGGVVSFHHGSYLSSGKEAMQDLIGATATGSVPWNTVDGQNVINVAPSHFVTTNGVEYPSSTAYSDPGRGVPADTYSFFQNVPDERYINFEINPGAGDFEVLFASNYNENGTTHLLGFTHRRPEWAGVVVGYQPGEYQPNALDDPDGNNFQILANAIVYAAGVLCGNGTLESSAGEECDEGTANNGASSCCDAHCQFKPNGAASCDGNLCTRSDTCTNGVCTPGGCAHTQACSICGGTCINTGSACECQ